MIYNGSMIDGDSLHCKACTLIVTEVTTYVRSHLIKFACVCVFRVMASLELNTRVCPKNKRPTKLHHGCLMLNKGPSRPS